MHVDLNDIHNIIYGTETNLAKSRLDENEKKLTLSRNVKIRDIFILWQERSFFSMWMQTLFPCTFGQYAPVMWKARNDIFNNKNEYSFHVLVKYIVAIKCGT